MTDKAPERIWAWKDLFGEGRVWRPEGGPLPEMDGAWGGDEYVRADLLDAANARIAVLEDKLGLERALSDGAHRRARNARAEALEEAAAKADDWTLTAEEVANGTGWPANVGENIGDAIRALKGGSNG